MAEEKSLSVQKIQREVDLELSNPETLKTLVATTFQKLSPENVKQAMVEGMLRGFTFKDFLEKNVYAIPYGAGYNLVTSIDYARKIGFRSGISGVDEPKYEEDSRGTPIACSVTVKRKLPGSDVIGEFTAKVYMSEYSTNQNLWAKKPRSMLAKVAEAHALRKACPEELSQAFIAEEMERGDKKEGSARPTVDIPAWERKLKATQSLEELKSVWASSPAEVKVELEDLKNGLKSQYEVGTSDKK